MNAKKVLGSLLFVLLAGCNERATLAPVQEFSGIERPYYIAGQGDTLYSIAWQFDKDYRELAYYNHMSDDKPIHVGQKIYLIANTKPETIAPRPVYATKAPVAKPIKAARSKRWQWPVKGVVVNYFSTAEQQKGINVRATPGAPVRASQGGRVAYSGDGLRGYGNLIIVKHPGDYLSAYAFNRKNLVKEGQIIKAGQTIAEMGSKDGQGVLHFEVRYRGKPVNPLSVLPSH